MGDASAVVPGPFAKFGFVCSHATLGAAKRLSMTFGMAALREARRALLSAIPDVTLARARTTGRRRYSFTRRTKAPSRAGRM
jgi:hypothetical protein